MKTIYNGGKLEQISLSEAERASLNHSISGWLYPYRLRISAPALLSDERPELLLYLYKCERVRGLAVERDGENIIIYCNEIVTSDIDIIKAEPRIRLEARDEAALEYLQGLGLAATLGG
jgi:hypothetical protein